MLNTVIITTTDKGHIGCAPSWYRFLYVTWVELWTHSPIFSVIRTVVSVFQCVLSDL